MSGNQMLLLGGAQAPAVDPFFYSVTSLLHGDGTNGGQNNTFLDSSTNNFTITRNGNTTQGSFSPFSQTGWSNFNPDSNNGIGVATNAALNMGTGDFTVEAWVNTVKLPTTNAFQTSSGGYQCVFGTGPNSSASGSQLYIGVTNLFFDISTDGGGPINVAHGMSPGQWYHVAITRSGNTFRAFINGTLVQTATSSASWVDGYAYGIMRAEPIGGYNGAWWYGYVSNFRVVKGTAVYTASFTPSTTPLTAISGTSLLTCQSNRFIDNSTNAFTVSVNNSPSVQPFSPFNPITAYSTSAVGGSGYFDGSGDKLLVATNSNMTLGTSDFTIELWAYPLSLSGARCFTTQADPTFDSSGYFIGSNGTSLYWLVGDGSWALIRSVGTLNLNAWNHIALTRSGTTFRAFIDGVLVDTQTSSVSLTNANNNVSIGGRDAGATQYSNGYLSGYRVLKGTCLYTATFTPPAAPPTAIANTQLLTNFTNGAIFDNAAVADYETVGNAQISTSVKKYGTGSMYFDGTGDYLSTPFSQLCRIMGGNFTVEMWVYLNAAQANMGLVSSYSSNNGWLVRLDTSAIVFSYGTGGAATVVSNSASLSTGVWYHIAFCKIDSSLKAYVNGTQVGTTTTISGAVDTTATGLQIGRTHTVANDFNGYIDDLRISNGVARYPYNFTPPTAEFPNIGGTVTLTADPYFEYTTLLLPGNGTNGAQNNTFLDSSSNAFSITRNGNTTQGTFSPFSQTGWGNYFDGSGDYLTATSNAAYAFGTGDFTIEAWVYSTNYSGTNAIFDTRTAGNEATGVIFYIRADGKIEMYRSAAVVTASTALLQNSWNHVALTRSGSTCTLWLNGTSVGTATDSTNLTQQNSFIGAAYTGVNNLMVGYISNLRVVKGTAVYTSNFTPSTTPLTAITNTSLLTCQSNRFIDNSTNNFAITRNGDVSVQAFSPFNPTASWSAATNGGSGYFDGSGDYLDASASAGLGGSGNFTLQAWIYPTTVSGDCCIYETRGGTGWVLFINSTGYLQVFDSAANLQTASTTQLRAYQWTHIALVKNGSTCTYYVNGSAAGTFTLSSFAAATRVRIGARNDAAATYFGWITDLRTDTTNLAITVPTAPLTAGANTNYLLNFTNAGIYDATSKNDLETVGNAQISTTQSKFGGSSMYFDGSGDYLLAPWNPLTDLGAGDFTIEFWIYPTAVGQSSVTYLFNLSTSGAYGPILIGQAASGYGIVLYSSSTGSSWNLASGSSFGTATANAWNHVALTRYGADVRLFLNGVIGTTLNWGTTALLTGSTYRTNVGSATGVANTFYTGYMQDLRVTKGIARYTSNFTPPSTAFLTL